MKRTDEYDPGQAAQMFLAMYCSTFDDKALALIRPALYRLLTAAYEAGKRKQTRVTEEGAT